MIEACDETGFCWSLLAGIYIYMYDRYDIFNENIYIYIYYHYVTMISPRMKKQAFTRSSKVLII